MLHKQKISGFHKNLHNWYAKNGRKFLPWRNTLDPYAIYISEIMLQQTQVKTVLERYYFQFLEKFPTLKSLANASQKKVLLAWQGLGYYSRAINLHKAANACGEKLPNSVDKLIQLPGIGRNSAHAICAFAYHQPVAVMEANVKRVLCRIFELENPKEALLWEFAELLLDRQNPFDYNQAMMDVGSMVCTKKAPKCGICPAAKLCKGKHAPQLYPTLKPKKNQPILNKIIVVLQNKEGKYFSVRRETKFLGGLYHFSEENKKPANSIYLGHIHQQYSHFTLEADIYLLHSPKTGKNWYSMVQLKTLPMSMAEQKIVRLL